MSAVSERLKGKPTLIILDNFEQVTPAGALLIDFLVACPDLRILVTSRETLRVRGEWHFQVEGLALPDDPAVPGSMSNS